MSGGRVDVCTDRRSSIDELEREKQNTGNRVGWRHAVMVLTVASLTVACAPPAGMQPTAQSTSAPAGAADPGGMLTKADPGGTLTKADPGGTLANVSPGGTLTKVSVSYSERVGSYLPLILAQDQGIFKKHGLDPEIQLMTGATGMSALLSGQVQIAHIGGSEVVSAEASGGDLVMSGNLGAVSSYVFIVAPNINTVEDLRGKQVGISSVGGSADTATRLSMLHYGLDPDKDIIIVPLGSLQNRSAGLLNGAIQAAPSNPPEAYLLQRQGFHVLFDVADLGLPFANATIVAQRSWINDHKDAFQAWNDSIVESIALAKSKPEVGLPVLKQFLQSDDDALMRETYDFWINKIIRQPPTLTPEQFSETLASLAKNNPKVKAIDINRMIDGSFVQNAVARGLAGQP